MSDVAVFENVPRKPGGINYAFVSTPGGYRPLHWHPEIELYYTLNGITQITVEGITYDIPKRELFVINSETPHSFFCHNATSMYLCVLISTEEISEFMPDISEYEITCIPKQINDYNMDAYLDICAKMEKLTEKYILGTTALTLDAPGIILQVLATLIENFSEKKTPANRNADKLTRERIHSIISFTEKHYTEEISLDDGALLLGLGREYFCRFIKKNMGKTFLEYVNEVRIAHAYKDLINTDMSVSSIMEKNGFTNQKLFNRTFKSIYGDTPSSIRKRIS